MLINMVYASTVGISTNNLCKCYFSLILFNKFNIFYKKYIETDLRLVDERCVMSFPGNLQGYIFTNYCIYVCLVNRNQLYGDAVLIIFLIIPRF